MERVHSTQFLHANSENFGSLALDIFRLQAEHNPVYSEYIKYLGVDPVTVVSISEIPFLPISLFRTHRVVTGSYTPEVVFRSSGTTNSDNHSLHPVDSLGRYRDSFSRCFRLFYGSPHQYCILALLPSYIERGDSSLVYMVNELINGSGSSLSRFFGKGEENEVAGALETLETNAQPTILIGVTFALLELVRKQRFSLKHTIVMETGGMKGQGRELTRAELHTKLTNGFGVSSIHSEYGMTELLSQAYSKGNGTYHCPPWMAVQMRDPYDPFTQLPHGQTGAINVVDLANTHSCAFIQTDDLGVSHPNGSFTVLGRLDGSQIRGCNLMVVS